MTHFIKHKKSLLCLGSYMLFSLTMTGQNIQQVPTDSVKNDSTKFATQLNKEVNLGFRREKKSNVIGAMSSINPHDFLKYDNT